MEVCSQKGHKSANSFNENAFFEKIRFFYIFFEFKELKMSPTKKKKTNYIQMKLKVRG